MREERQDRRQMMPAKETLRLWLLPAVAGTACLVGLGAVVWRGHAKPGLNSSVNTASAVDVASAVPLAKLVSEPAPTATSGGTGVPPLRSLSQDPRVALLLDSNADDTARNEAAVALRQSGYKGFVGDCLTVLNNPEEKERFRSFVVQYLGESARAGNTHVGATSGRDLGESGPMVPPTQDRILATLHESLGDRHLAVRREALLALVRLRDPEGIETVHRWLHESGPNAAALLDLAIRCTQELDLREELPCIRGYARLSGQSADSRGVDTPPTSEVVRIAALVALSQWGDEESRPAFQEAAQSNSIRLQRAGKTALARLDRLKAGPSQARSKE